MPVASAQRPTLEKLEKYEVVEEIGHGGMATVYRARDTRLDRWVALKVMHPHLLSSEAARARFTREALTVARLKHPNIVEIYDYSGDDSEQCFIATELLSGPTLKQVIEQHASMPAEVAACFAVAVARALAAAHAAGIVHRDVKPENVLIHEDREVKLADFGIAQLADSHTMTTTGQVLGSPAHMAPEQVEGKACDARSDVFALGTVLYALATGELPFRGRNAHQVLKRIVDGKLTDPMQLRPSIGEPLRHIIMRCLQTEASQRYPDAQALEAELTGFLSEMGVDDPTVCLAAYLGDPAGEAERIRQRSIARLIEGGDRAQREGRIPEAMHRFNRVLALDEGNADVLRRLEQIGRRSRLKRVGWVAALLLLGLSGLGLFELSAVSRQQDTSEDAENAGGAAMSAADAPQSSDPQSESLPAEQPAAGAAAATGSSSELRPRQASVSPDPTEEETAEPRAKADQAEADDHKPAGAQRARAAAATARRRAEAVSDEPRRVVFKPTPANVSISVDGSEPRAFGPSFRSVELEPGEHRFTFIGSHDCCDDAAVTVDIPPGPGTTVVEQELQFRPAGLYVVSNTPANVVIDGGELQGRTRNVIRVPIKEDLDELHRVKVTAPGYEDYTQAVQLRAGRVETVEVTLEPKAGDPP